MGSIYISSKSNIKEVNHVKEEQKHIDAFEEYFILRQNDPSMSQRGTLMTLSGIIGVSYRTLQRWVKEFDWNGRESIRQHDIQNKVAEKTNTALADNKAWYLKINHDMIRKFEESNPHIETVKDYDTIIKTSLTIQGDDKHDTNEIKELLTGLVEALGKEAIRPNSIGVKDSFDSED
jgi:hypothetical protein